MPVPTSQEPPFTRSLADGRCMLVREVEPEDRFLIETGFRELSVQSRFFRFMNAHPNLSEAELNRFAASSDADHFAIGAVETGEGPPLPAAIARYIRLPQAPGSAEIAITVVDRYQGLGIGGLLLAQLSDRAARDGIDTFVAHVSPMNRAMLGLLRRHGAQDVQSARDEVELRLPVPIASGVQSAA